MINLVSVIDKLLFFYEIIILPIILKLKLNYYC